jgi:hypothetical protein
VQPNCHSCIEQYREICGKHGDNSETANRRFSRIFKNFVVEFFNKEVIDDGRAAAAIFMVRFYSAVFELPNSLTQFPLSHYTWPPNTTKRSMNFGRSKIYAYRKPTNASN